MSTKQLIVLEYDIKESKTWFTLTSGDFLYNKTNTDTTSQVNAYEFIVDTIRTFDD